MTKTELTILKEDIENIQPADGVQKSSGDELKEGLDINKAVIYKRIHERINEFIKKNYQLYSRKAGGLGLFNMYTFINPILGTGNQIETQAMIDNTTLVQIKNTNNDNILLKKVFQLYDDYIKSRFSTEIVDEIEKQEKLTDELTKVASVQIDKYQEQLNKTMNITEKEEIRETIRKLTEENIKKISMIDEYDNNYLDIFNKVNIEQDDEAFKTMLEEISNAFKNASEELGKLSHPDAGGRKHKSRRRRRRKSGKKSRKSRRKSKKSRKTRRHKSKKSRKTRRRRRR